MDLVPTIVLLICIIASIWEQHAQMDMVAFQAIVACSFIIDLILLQYMKSKIAQLRQGAHVKKKVLTVSTVVVLSTLVSLVLFFVYDVYSKVFGTASLWVALVELLLLLVLFYVKGVKLMAMNTFRFWLAEHFEEQGAAALSEPLVQP